MLTKTTYGPAKAGHYDCLVKDESRWTKVKGRENPRSKDAKVQRLRSKVVYEAA